MQHAETIERGRKFVITPGVSGFSEKTRQQNSAPYTRRLEIDQRHAEMRLERQLKEPCDE